MKDYKLWNLETSGQKTFVSRVVVFNKNYRTNLINYKKTNYGPGSIVLQVEFEPQDQVPQEANEDKNKVTIDADEQ